MYLGPLEVTLDQGVCVCVWGGGGGAWTSKLPSLEVHGGGSPRPLKSWISGLVRVLWSEN